MIKAPVGAFCRRDVTSEMQGPNQGRPGLGTDWPPLVRTVTRLTLGNRSPTPDPGRSQCEGSLNDEEVFTISALLGYTRLVRPSLDTSFSLASGPDPRYHPPRRQRAASRLRTA